MRVKCYEERVPEIALEYGFEEKDIINIFDKLTAPGVKENEDAGAVIYESKEWDMNIKYKKEKNDILISADTLMDALGWHERWRLYEYLRKHMPEVKKQSYYNLKVVFDLCKYKTRQCPKRDIFIHVLCTELLKISKPNLLQ